MLSAVVADDVERRGLARLIRVRAAVAALVRNLFRCKVNNFVECSPAFNVTGSELV